MKKMFRNKIVRFKKMYKFAHRYFFIKVIFFLPSIKNVFLKTKNSIFPPKYTSHAKNVTNKIVYFKKTFNFVIDYYFIRVITFVY